MSATSADDLPGSLKSPEAASGPVPGKPAPTGPRYVHHEDAVYRARLAKEVRGTWYHQHKALEPRGFARQDKESGPSAGDLVVTKRTVHLNAARAMKDLMAGHVPWKAEWECLEVVVHEHTHCLVRLQPDGSDHPGDARIYGHPDKPVEAVIHAFGPDCRLGVNAFTGLLRLRPSPRRLRDELIAGRVTPRTEAWHLGLLWFGQHVDAQPLPWQAP